MEEKEKDELATPHNLNNSYSNVEEKRFAAPARELNFALSFVAKIYKELKPGVYHSKEDIASVHKLAVNSIKSLLSTAQQYNLLELKYGLGYKVSPLFEKIFLATNNTEKKNSIIESLSHPVVYNHIFKEYDGRTFPGKAELNNILIKKYNLKNTVSNKIVEILFQNLTDFNLINGSTILALKGEKSEAIKNEMEIVFEKPKKEADPLPLKIIAKPESTNSEVIEIIIPMKNKMKATVRIPEEYTDADLEKIARIVQAYKDVESE